MLSATIIDTWETFTGLEPVWNSLLAESDLDIPQMTFEWLSCWWRHYGGGKKLVVIAVRRGNDLVALMPFMRGVASWRGMPMQALTFMANCHSMRAGCISAGVVPELGTFLLDTLRARPAPLDLLLFEYVHKPSCTASLIEEALDERRFTSVVFEGSRSPYIKIEGTWQSYLKTRRKSLREKINYMGNVLQRQGNVDITRFEEGKEPGIERMLEDMFAVSRATWKYQEHTAIASSVQDMQFYAGMARKAAEKGWLDLWVMSIEGKPAAFVYNLAYKNRVFALKSGFDDSFRKIAPGKYLNHLTIRASFDRGHTEFDMMGKDDPFKMLWTSLFRRQYRYAVFMPTIRGQAAGLLEKTAVPLARRLAWGGRRH